MDIVYLLCADPAVPLEMATKTDEFRKKVHLSFVCSYVKP